MTSDKAGNPGETDDKISAPERTVTGQWLPGHAKRGGRRSGVKSWSARAMAETTGCDALAVLMEVVLTGYLPLTPGEDPKSRKKLPNESRLKAAMELAQYMYPKLASTALTGENGGPVALATCDVTQLMQDPAMVSTPVENSPFCRLKNPQPPSGGGLQFQPVGSTWKSAGKAEVGSGGDQPAEE